MVVSIGGLQHEAARYWFDIADRPPNLEHFYSLKGQVAGLAPVSEPGTFHVTAMSDSMAAALSNQTASC